MRALILAAATAALVLGTILGAPVARAQMPPADQIIKAWDKDGDGTVSKEEWVAAGRPAERFEFVDANHDGKITVEELEAAMARMRNGGAGGANGGPPAQHPPAAQPQPSAQPQPPAASPHG